MSTTVATQENKISARTIEILNAHGLNFQILKKQLASHNPHAEKLIDEIKSASIKGDAPLLIGLCAELSHYNEKTPYYGLFHSETNECINTVKEGYVVSNNDEVVEMVLRGTERFGSALSVSKAGSLNGGRKVFIQLKIEGVGVVENDIIERFITILDSNDGSTSLSIGIADLTMSCSNQFAKFYKAGEAKFRHSASMEEKIKTIPYLIETALSNSLKQIEIYKDFATREIKEINKHEMVKHVLGYDRNITSVTDLSKKGARSINIMDKLYNHIDREINGYSNENGSFTEGKGLNLWGLHSGVTSFTTHEHTAPKRDNGRIESILNGASYKINQQSLGYALNKSGILELV